MNRAELIEKALLAGLSDESYMTVRNGYITKYKGIAFVRDDGGAYILEGYGPKGNAYDVYKQGGVNIFQMKGDPDLLKKALAEADTRIKSAREAAKSFEYSHKPEDYLLFGSEENIQYNTLYRQWNSEEKSKIELYKSARGKSIS